MKNLQPQLKLYALIITACLAVAAAAFALDPPPSGGYSAETTALGEDALFNEVNGGVAANTAIGFQALYTNTIGTSNTAVGDSALHDNTSGFANAALGNQALTANTTGFGNTGVGDTALRYNTTGWSNVAVGEGSLGLSNGAGNTGIGEGAMFFSTTGNWNTALGNKALAFNSTGTFNTALGYSALNQNTTGTYNIGIGAIAGQKLGAGSHNIEIANQGTPDDSGTIRVGTRSLHHNTYIAGISGVTVASGVGVIIDAQGHLGTVTSSARYKEAIKPMDKTSEAILSLEPVAFRYNHDLDPAGIPQFGLVAEDVAKVDPNLVVRDDEGKPYTVRYEAVNAMLLNEFLKEHKKVEELEKQLQAVTARLDARGL